MKDFLKRRANGQDAYFVAVETDLGKLWAVIGPDDDGDDICESTFYENQEEAQDMAEKLNRAFYLGAHLNRKS